MRGLIAACLALRRLWTPTSLWAIFLQFAACGLVYLPAIWFISMTPDDRADLRHAIRTAMVSWRQRHDRTGGTS